MTLTQATGAPSDQRVATADAPFAYSDYEFTGSNPLAGGSAFIEGQWVPASEARISIHDAGYLHSDVTYTAIHAWHGNIFRLDDHLDRLFSNAASSRIEPPFTRAETRQLIIEGVKRSELREAFISISVTSGFPLNFLGGDRNLHIQKPQMYLYVIPYSWIWTPAKIMEGVHAGIMQTVRRAGRNVIDPQVKNFAWGDLMRAVHEARDRGIDAPILLDSDGAVAEGPGYNVFIVKDGQLATPSRNALPGITRRTVVELARAQGYAVTERDIEVRELYAADEIFTSTTAGGITPVISIDGIPLGDGKPGAITLELLQRYWAAMDEQSGWITPVAYAAD